jgi:hypothetical protein
VAKQSVRGHKGACQRASGRQGGKSADAVANRALRAVYGRLSVAWRLSHVRIASGAVRRERELAGRRRGTPRGFPIRETSRLTSASRQP